MKTFNAPLLHRIAREFGTPVYVYDAAVIRERVASLKSFDTIRFAQKSCSNTHILRLMRSLGVQVDAVSLGEIERALRAGYTPGSAEPVPIVFTADLLDRATLKRVVELNIPVNVGSPQMIEQLGEAHPGHAVWIRINPGFGHGHSRKTNTGGPSSKHGIWHEHLPEALALVKKHRLNLVGLHMHIGSGVDYSHLASVCDAMVSTVQRLGHDLTAISAGGGLSIPYRESDRPIDTANYFRLWDAARQRIQQSLGHPVHLELEPGRYLVAESGFMLAEVRAFKEVGPNHFLLVDAGFDNLIRPAMYGAYHHISVIKQDGTPATGPTRPTVVAGPLCESGDVFTQDDTATVVPRDLPAASVGDFLLFHDTGAYASAMASNYNTRALAPEVLIDNGTPKLIRRRQPLADILALEDL